MNFYKFKKALTKAWGKDTAYRKDAPNWTPETPALGQCAITALLFNKYFGGEILSGVSDNGILHYWNKTKTLKLKVDLTKQQFSTPLKFKDIKIWDRNTLLETGDIAKRYQLLENRFLYIYNAKKIKKI